MNIHDKALLVQLNISTWSARKFDAEVTKAIEETYYANNSGRYNKILIATEHMAKIHKIVSAARKYHYENTLPWLDNGGRLLPTTNYFDYVMAMEVFSNKFFREVRKFITAYPDYVQEAQKRLNGMFCSDDYPPEYQLGEKFKMQIQKSPIPDDYRVKLNEDEIQSIREDYQQQLQELTRAANLELWQRLQKVLDHMLEKLSDADAKFKNSLVDNVSKICDLVPRLNISSDDQLRDIVDEVRQRLAGLAPASLRNNPELRTQAAQETQRIMAKLKHYMPAA
ncbi:MAG: hypothetical protein M0Q19_00535 [Candidatus Cloacimonetes bacterium]|jgi:hypothetical protein|nr:hypothetical protein [Candidatus Cloacimonadota bacterium]MDD3057623.1 hypothetical protein [Sphaerochaeta sp.]